MSSRAARAVGRHVPPTNAVASARHGTIRLNALPPWLPYSAQFSLGDQPSFPRARAVPGMRAIPYRAVDGVQRPRDATLRGFLSAVPTCPSAHAPTRAAGCADTADLAGSTARWGLR